MGVFGLQELYKEFETAEAARKVCRAGAVWIPHRLCRIVLDLTSICHC